MNKTKQTKTNAAFTLLVHILVWAVIFTLPFLMFLRNSSIPLHEHLAHQSVNVISLMLIFYLNFFWLIEKYMFNKKSAQYIAYNIIVVLLLGISVYIWKENHSFSVVKPERLLPPPPKIPMFIFRDILSLVIAIGMSIAFKMTDKWYKTEAERQEAEQKRIAAELTNLRQQLNPHFLFNTLNNIYALVAISPEKAQEAILELSHLLRYVLYDNNEERVSLKNEVNFIENYVKLMRLRLAPEIDLELTINVKSMEMKLPPLLFITLVENAFKHGISHTKKSFIDIEITENDKKQLVCSVQNSYFPKDETDRSGSGIGLENLRRRLNILYPNKHILNCEQVGDSFIAELILMK